MAARRTAKRPKLSTQETKPRLPAASEREPKLTCRFFRTDKGNEPVREWLKELGAEVRQEIGSDIQVVQWRWPLGKPLVDGFGDGLFEVRTSHRGNIYRVLFCLEGSIIVLLHGFTKKSRKTPDQDIDIARKRQREENEP